MSLTAGAATVSKVGSSTASLDVAVATSGSSPYSYQWYRDVNSGFTPGAGNSIAGATSRHLDDSGLEAGTAYFYKNRVTDSLAAHADSAQVEVDTVAVQDPNQFAETSIAGMLDLRFNPDTVAVQIDDSQVDALPTASAVSIVDDPADGLPKVVGVSGNDDTDFMGFLNYSIKDRQFKAGQRAEISTELNVMFLISTGAISRGHQVCLDTTYDGGVADIDDASAGDVIVGDAYDGADGAGQLIRVKIGPRHQVKA